MEKIFSVDWPELFIPTHSILEMLVRGSLMYVGLFLILRFIAVEYSHRLNDNLLPW